MSTDSDIDALVEQLREKALWREDIHHDLHIAAADVITKLRADLQTSNMQIVAMKPLYSRRQLEEKLSALEAANAMHLANKAMDALVISAAAARDMRRRAAITVRNSICTMSWPPEDGDELIDMLMAAIVALPENAAPTSEVIATTCATPSEGQS